jgi:hypothetical protein
MERELWRILYRLTLELDRPWGEWRYATADVLAAYFWAVLHDRPTKWAADPKQWPDDLRPVLLPPQSTLSRRLRRPRTIELMTAVEEHLLAITVVGSCLVRIIDGKALAVSGVSKDPDIGYGRGAGGNQKGYKLHAVWGAGPMPTAWGLASMNVSEKSMARHLIGTLPGSGYLLADAQYDANPLYDLAAETGFQFVAKKTKDRGRGGLGHRRQSAGRLRSMELLGTPFGRALFNQRNTIECRFGAWVSLGGGLGPLPAWVRRFSRVRNWVQAKILAAGARCLFFQDEHKLALA